MIPLLPTLLFLFAAILNSLPLDQCRLAPLPTPSCLALLRNPLLLLALLLLLLSRLATWKPRRAWLRKSGLVLLLLIQLAVVVVLTRGLYEVRGSIKSTVERIGSEQQEKLAEQKFANVSNYQRSFLGNFNNVLGMGLNTTVHSDIPLKDLIVRYLVDSLEFYPNLQVFGDLQTTSIARFKSSLSTLKTKNHFPVRLLEERFQGTNTFLDAALILGLAAVAFRLFISFFAQTKTSMIAGVMLMFLSSLTMEFLDLVVLRGTAGSLSYLTHLNLDPLNFNCKARPTSDKVSLQFLQITRAERLFARIQALRSDRPFPSELLRQECASFTVEFSSWDCVNKSQCRGVEQLASNCRPLQLQVIKQKVAIVREIIGKIKVTWVDTQLLLSDMNSGSVLNCQKQLGNLFSKSFTRVRAALQKAQTVLLLWPALLLVLVSITYCMN